MNKPHKSTTTPEFFFHIEGNAGTVFFRIKDGKWNASTALCDPRDNFSRQRGRSEARRKFFQGKRKEVELPEHVSRPRYDDAVKVYSAAFQQRLNCLLSRSLFT